MNQNWLVTAFFFALLAVILYCAFLILSPFFTAITWAAILAVLTYPAYAWVLKLLRGRATPAALILIDNILKPFFIGTRIKMPLFFLFFGILGGLVTFGALGLILGPVVFALLAALLDLYIEEYGSAKQ